MLWVRWVCSRSLQSCQPAHRPLDCVGPLGALPLHTRAESRPKANQWHPISLCTAVNYIPTGSLLFGDSHDCIDKVSLQARVLSSLESYLITHSLGYLLVHLTTDLFNFLNLFKFSSQQFLFL